MDKKILNIIFAFFFIFLLVLCIGAEDNLSTSESNTNIQTGNPSQIENINPNLNTQLDIQTNMQEAYSEGSSDNNSGSSYENVFYENIDSLIENANTTLAEKENISNVVDYNLSSENNESYIPESNSLGENNTILINTPVNENNSADYQQTPENNNENSVGYFNLNKINPEINQSSFENAEAIPKEKTMYTYYNQVKK
jgi:hypothetical protein